jgi:hypothetical protein
VNIRSREIVCMKEYGNVSQRCLRTCLLFFVSVLAATFEFMQCGE